MSESGCYFWTPINLEGKVHLEGTLPNGAVIGGWERDRPTYVARARHEGHWEVGKLNAWARIGYSYLGKEFESAKGEILVATSGQSPVWINAAFGEAIDSVMSSRARDHIQLIGRVWHKDRWIPGKVVPFCHRLYFPYGGRELSSRKYQLLSTDFSWEPAEPNGTFAMRTLVAVDSCMPIDATNCLALSCQGPVPDAADIKVLARSSLRECNWVVSGDGEYVRHAITNEEGFQLARVWMEDSSSMGHWVPGCVNAGGSLQPGMLAAGSRHLDYQVLTASPVPQSLREGSAEVSRLLSLSISLDTLDGMLENDLTPPESIFIITKLEPGERPWSAVRDMMSQNSKNALERKVSDHLRPMMPVIEEQAKKEDSAAETLPSSATGAE